MKIKIRIKEGNREEGCKKMIEVGENDDVRKSVGARQGKKEYTGRRIKEGEDGKSNNERIGRVEIRGQAKWKGKKKKSRKEMKNGKRVKGSDWGECGERKGNG